MANDKKNPGMIILIIAAVAVLAFFIYDKQTPSDMLDEVPEEEAPISVTAYRCDEVTKTCVTLATVPSKTLTTITGAPTTFEFATHFSMTVASTVPGAADRNVDSLRIMSDTESPVATTIGGITPGDENRFFEALKNENLVPPTFGTTTPGTTRSWNTRDCDNDASPDCTDVGFLNQCVSGSDAGCDAGAGEQCRDIGSGEDRCLMSAGAFDVDCTGGAGDTCTFTAAVEGNITRAQGDTLTLTSSSGIGLSFTTDPGASSFYDVQVTLGQTQ